PQGERRSAGHRSSHGVEQRAKQPVNSLRMANSGGSAGLFPIALDKLHHAFAVMLKITLELRNQPRGQPSEERGLMLMQSFVHFNPTAIAQSWCRERLRPLENPETTCFTSCNREWSALLWLG